jgi:A/G-specific adenine glycosylase
MTEVPGSEWTSQFDEISALAQAPIETEWRRVSGRVIHVFTHFRLELNVYCAEAAPMEQAPPGCWWAPAATLSGEALPSVMRKAIEAAFPGATRRRSVQETAT